MFKDPESYNFVLSVLLNLVALINMKQTAKTELHKLC